MNSAKIFSGGLLLLSAGCLTAPGDLGAVGGESSGGSESEGTSTDPSQGASSMGSSGEAETTDAMSTTGSESGEESTGEPIDPPQCGVGSGMERRLTSTQFENAIADLFEVSVDVQLEDDAIPFESAQAVSAVDAMAIATVAATVADEFAVPECGVDETATCAEEFLNSYVPVVLRGKVGVDAFMPVYEEVGEYEAGIRAVVGAMITHPAFVDVTPTGTEQDGVIALDGSSLATRLSLLVWNTVPGSALLEAGDALLEPGGVEAQIGSMLADTRFERTQAELFATMTGVRSMPSADRSSTYEDWSEATGASMLEEQRRFIIGEFAAPDTTLEDLLTSSSTFVNAEIAGLYGDDLQTPAPAGSGWAPAELDPTRRAGLLTQTGMISVGSDNRPADSYRAPVGRGMAVLSSFLCGVLPPPPAGVDIVPPDSLQTREDWEEQLADNTCQSCHSLSDPLGFASGDYDAVGRWDPRGDATNATHDMLDEEYADVRELGAVLAADDDVHACMAERYYTFALRRGLGEMDACAVEQFTDAFADSGGDLRALVQAIATSDVFRLARP